MRHFFATRPIAIPLFVLFAIAYWYSEVSGQVVYGNNGLEGGFRWDAAPRVISGLERSLDGGLRYSLEGGSVRAFRDLFNWTQVPTEVEFATLIQDAFDAWSITDPVSGFGSSLTFVSDTATLVDSTLMGGAVAASTGAPGVRFGAEIDLFAKNLGSPNPRAQAAFSTILGPVQLTSGTTDYPAGAISGADIFINANPDVIYSQTVFRRLLTHEIGHALGFDDVDASLNANNYIDDNFDGSSSASIVETLSNNWAHLVDPLNPSASQGLSLFDPRFALLGFRTVGVDILMESQGLGIGPNSPLENLTPLSNADYSIRQFLYPTLVPVDLETILGDCNQDGEVTFLDIAPFVAVLAAGGFLEEADCNEDGEVTFLDVPPLVEILNSL